MARSCLVALAFLTVLTACNEERWENRARDADETVDAVATEAALYAVTAEAAMGSISPEAQASAAASSAGTWFSPAGCVVATATGATVTYVLDQCTGPFGYAVFTDTVVITYMPRASGVAFTATADDLAVNRATVDLNETGTFSVAASGERTLTVTTQAAGRGGYGTPFTRAGDYVLTWTEARDCAGLDGMWDTTVGSVRWQTNVSGLRRCTGGCPAAGGTIEWSGANGTLIVNYDGSATASWILDARRDNAGTVELMCGMD